MSVLISEESLCKFIHICYIQILQKAVSSKILNFDFKNKLVMIVSEYQLLTPGTLKINPGNLERQKSTFYKESGALRFPGPGAARLCDLEQFT